MCPNEKNDGPENAKSGDEDDKAERTSEPGDIEETQGEAAPDELPPPPPQPDPQPWPGQPGGEFTLPVSPPPGGPPPPGQPAPPYPDPAGMYTLPMTPPPEAQLPPGQTPPPQWPAGHGPGQYPGPAGTFPPTPSPAVPPGTLPHTPAPQMGDTTPASTHPYHQAAYPATAPLPAASVFANRFEIIEQLGEGGMGQVFRVRDRQIENSEAALKVLHPRFSANPQFRDLFFKEINNSKKFVSEYVTQVRDTGHEQGRLFLTMDLVNGEPLRSLIDREQSLDARHALEITRQTLLGLSSGHEKGLIHRDIKPSNIMLVRGIAKTEDNPFGVGVRLLDFGIAAVAEELSEGQIAGTPLYMSPEQASGQKLDARSDLFSLGNVLFEMMSGSRLFGGKTVQDITTSVLNVQVGPRVEELDHLSPAIRKLLNKALEKDRKKRFQSAEEFIAAIEKSSAYRLPKGAPVWMGALLVVSMAAAAGAGYLAFEKTRALELLGVDSIGRAEHDSQIRAKEQEISTLETENRRLSNQSSETGDATGRIQSLTDDLAGKASQILGLQGDLKASRDTEDRLARDNTSLRDDVAAEKDGREAAEARVELLEYRDSPARRKGVVFDLIVSLVTKDQGRGAKVQLDAIQARDSLSPHDHDGGTFLGHLVSASEALHHYEEAPDPKLLALAESSLQSAQAGHDEFMEIARAWLETPVELGQETPPRGADLRAALDAITGKISQVTAANEASLNLLGEQSKSFHYGTDFNTVKDFADDNGFGMLGTFFARYDAAVHQSVEQDGRLLRDKLFALPHLQHWGTALAEQTAVLDTEATRSVIRLWEARAWHGGEGQAVDRGIVIPPGLDSIPRYDWRLQLALQMAMADLDSAAIPNNGIRNIYRDKRLDLGDQTQWVVDSLAGNGSGATITRKLYGATGKALTDPVRLPATFKNLRFSAGSVSLDLTQLDGNVSVALWHPDPGAAPPDGTVWSLNLDSDAFASKLSSAPVPCLVVKDGANEFWYSPRYGLVREHRPGFIFRDLVDTK